MIELTLATGHGFCPRFVRLVLTLIDQLRLTEKLHNARCHRPLVLVLAKLDAFNVELPADAVFTVPHLIDNDLTPAIRQPRETPFVLSAAPKPLQPRNPFDASFPL